MQTFFVWHQQLAPQLALPSSSSILRERKGTVLGSRYELRKLDALIMAETEVSESESQPPLLKVAVPSTEVEFVKCESCEFTEECTLEYISRVREKYQGRWICGLCVEAVKDEVMRSESLITVEEALNRHISFCNDFRSSSSPNEKEHPISAIGRLLRRSLDSPRSLPSTPSSVPPDSCFME